MARRSRKVYLEKQRHKVRERLCTKLERDAKYVKYFTELARYSRSGILRVIMNEYGIITTQEMAAKFRYLANMPKPYRIDLNEAKQLIELINSTQVNRMIRYAYNIAQYYDIPVLHDKLINSDLITCLLVGEQMGYNTHNKKYLRTMLDNMDGENIRNVKELQGVFDICAKYNYPMNKLTKPCLRLNDHYIFKVLLSKQLFNEESFIYALEHNNKKAAINIFNIGIKLTPEVIDAAARKGVYEVLVSHEYEVHEPHFVARTLMEFKHIKCLYDLFKVKWELNYSYLKNIYIKFGRKCGLQFCAILKFAEYYEYVMAVSDYDPIIMHDLIEFKYLRLDVLCAMAIQEHNMAVLTQCIDMGASLPPSSGDAYVIGATRRYAYTKDELLITNCLSKYRERYAGTISYDMCDYLILNGVHFTLRNVYIIAHREEYKLACKMLSTVNKTALSENDMREYIKFDDEILPAAKNYDDDPITTQYIQELIIGVARIL